MRICIVALGIGLSKGGGSVGGIAELVQSGETGLLVEPGNVTQLSDAIICLLENREKAAEMDVKGARYILGNFSTDITASRVEKELQALCS
jgi:phosphatidylinositol alpha-1,6-mannosyltransferase